MCGNMADMQSVMAEIRREKKRRKKERRRQKKPQGKKYNGLPYSIG